MKYCIKCGSELKGAKNFCMVCGSKQNKEKKDLPTTIPKKEKKTSKQPEDGTCFRCGDETDKKCFFCNEFVCRDHHNRLQANLNPYGHMQELKNLGESQRINEGWRGFIIFACSRCSGMKERKALSDSEMDKMNIPEPCSWYRLD